MAGLLRDTRGDMLLGGSVLGALTIGIALEAALSPSVPRPGLAGVVCISLLGCVILCWLRAAALRLLARAGARSAQRAPLADGRAARSPGVVADHADRRGQRGGLDLDPGQPDARRGARPAGAAGPGRHLDVHRRSQFPGLDRGGPSRGVRPSLLPRLPGSSRAAEHRSPLA